eukprot:COSAG06_NODE_827_length_12062_cov_46.356182_2_plen_446_part_00
MSASTSANPIGSTQAFGSESAIPDPPPDSPAAAPGPVVASSAVGLEELEQALAGLRDGSVTEAEAMAAMQRMVDARIDARLARNGGLEGTIKHICAHLTEAPTNWHQSVVFYLTSDAPEDKAMKKWLPLMFTIGFLMVFAQVATAMAVAVGVALPSCLSSEQCDAGMYCQVGFSNRCAYCGSNAPVYMQTDPITEDTYNAVFNERFVGFNATLVAQICRDPESTPVTCANLCPTSVMHFEGSEIGRNYDMTVGDAKGRSCGEICEEWACHNGGRRAVMGGMECKGDGGALIEPGYPIGFMSSGNWDKPYSYVQIREWCDFCVHEITFDVSPLSQYGLMKNNVGAMKLFDWIALAFSCFIVSFQVVGELKDIWLCDLAMQHALAKGKTDEISTCWKVGMWSIGMLRRWVFLTLLVITVPLLVVYKGGDALSVCFNTIAILFMTEIE